MHGPEQEDAEHADALGVDGEAESDETKRLADDRQLPGDTEGPSGVRKERKVRWAERNVR